ncbi:hypothetical protein [Pedobacter frigiditerrae]|uniref:hypothetical protein n=1 Tax=Pedobacter frigiditerrae TaxID=2530452 RepID=UPI00292FA9CD|nr:hypothetical protein [Pedobacter frigiditerrae]
MKIYYRSNIRILILILSIIFISSSWILKDLEYAIFGSIIYCLALVFDTIFLIIDSKSFKAGKPIIDHERKIDKIFRIVEGILVMGSLIALAHPNKLYSIPGKTIWYGQLIVFILVGPIVGIFANIQLEVGYGGWRPKKYRK